MTIHLFLANEALFKQWIVIYPINEKYWLNNEICLPIGHRTLTLKALNVKVNDNQLKQLVKEMDTDGSGMYKKISN